MHRECFWTLPVTASRSPRGLDRQIQAIAKESGIEYSGEQTQAIREAATSGLLLITGGPGTGKTTILRGILELLGQNQLRCLLAAPTGRAAKRLTEVTGGRFHHPPAAGSGHRPAHGEDVLCQRRGKSPEMRRGDWWTKCPWWTCPCSIVCFRQFPRANG